MPPDISRAAVVLVDAARLFKAMLGPIATVEPQDPGPGILDHGSRALDTGAFTVGMVD
ncbi:MAG: hypothetical protein ACKVI1_03520 [Flavobacteriales bacterium]|nr:hypothetical protein [Planktomarina sp.]